MFNAKYKPTIITAQPAIGDLRQEFNENGMHRIVHSDGTVTPFVRYESFAYYGGFVSVTSYWADEGLYSAADFALMMATSVVATKQQAADFESGKGRVLMCDLADTPVDLFADDQVAVSVANSPKDYTKKPVSYCEDVIDCEDDLDGCTHIVEGGTHIVEDGTRIVIVEDDVSGDAEPELRERAINMLATLLAAAAKPVTRH